jgi:hypothetical protein
MFENRHNLVSLTLVLLAAACGGGQPAPEAAPPPEPVPEAAPPPEPGPAEAAPEEAAPAEPPAPAAWTPDLTKEQKAAFMKAHVAPRMAKVFQEANAEKYANFDCKTCHGPDFKLPKDHLPKLTMKKDKMTAFTEKPDVSKFMAEKVVPEMASILGMQPFDPKTKQGFGCMGCHTVEQK